MDKGNLGPSAFVGVGDYTGGGLWVHGKGVLDAKYQWWVGGWVGGWVDE